MTAAGTTVILYAGSDLTIEKETMPDVTGMTYAQARDALGRQGLFLRSDSTILADSETVRVAIQSVPAGTILDRGSVAEVTLINNDDESYGLY